MILDVAATVLDTGCCSTILDEAAADDEMETGAVVGAELGVVVADDDELLAADWLLAVD